MKLLLDTHIWIWSVDDKPRLKPSVLHALQDPANEKWLSPISLWELMVLVEKRRVTLNMSVEEWIGQALKEAPIREAPLTAEVVLALLPLWNEWHGRVVKPVIRVKDIVPQVVKNSAMKIVRPRAC